MIRVLMPSDMRFGGVLGLGMLSFVSVCAPSEGQIKYFTRSCGGISFAVHQWLCKPLKMISSDYYV